MRGSPRRPTSGRRRLMAAAGARRRCCRRTRHRDPGGARLFPGRLATWSRTSDARTCSRAADERRTVPTRPDGAFIAAPPARAPRRRARRGGARRRRRERVRGGAGGGARRRRPRARKRAGLEGLEGLEASLAVPKIRALNLEDCGGDRRVRRRRGAPPSARGERRGARRGQGAGEAPGRGTRSARRRGGRGRRRARARVARDPRRDGRRRTFVSAAWRRRARLPTKCNSPSALRGSVAVFRPGARVPSRRDVVLARVRSGFEVALVESETEPNDDLNEKATGSVFARFKVEGVERRSARRRLRRSGSTQTRRRESPRASPYASRSTAAAWPR